MNDVQTKVRVYMVEDEKLLVEGLSAILELEDDIEVVGAEYCAESAIEQLRDLEVDVVLMDIQLPGMNGIEAMRIIGNEFPGLVVVALTSAGPSNVADAVLAGAKGFVLKTCDRARLVAAIKSALAGEIFIDPSLTGDLVRELFELRKSNRILTARQITILRLVAEGEHHKHIAESLFVSERTIAREMHEIYDRLKVSDAAQAVAQAKDLALL